MYSTDFLYHLLKPLIVFLISTQCVFVCNHCKVIPQSTSYLLALWLLGLFLQY